MRSHLRHLILMLWLFATLFPMAGGAEAGDFVSPDSPAVSESPALLDYARELYQKGDLNRAAGEVKRFLFFHPDHPRAVEARGLLQRIQDDITEFVNKTDHRSFTPWVLSQSGESRRERLAQTEKRSGLAIGLIHFYQNNLRSFKRTQSHCPSCPHCSEYAIQAIGKHGAFLGTWIYVDRLWREVTTAGLPPFVTYRGRECHYDPLEQNDYWLPKAEVDQP